jgi:hypothetical protein
LVGRIDATEVSILSSYMAAPREGHLSAIMHVYSWLKSHDRSEVVLDPSDVEHVEEPQPDWFDFYSALQKSYHQVNQNRLGKLCRWLYLLTAIMWETR